MSLTVTDLTAIRQIMLNAIDVIVIPRFEAIEARFDQMEDHLGEHSRQLQQLEVKIDTVDGRVEALENDIKAIYRREY